MRIFVSVLLGFIVHTGFSEESDVVKNQNGLLSQSINCIEASGFALWVGSDKGINRVEIDGDSVTQVSSRQTTKPVLSICDDNKFLWVGIAQKGLYLFNKKTYKFEGKFKKELGSKHIISLKKEANQLFVQTKSNEFYVVILSDTSIQSNSLKNSFFEELRKVVVFKGNRYKGSDKGILLLTSNAIKETGDVFQDSVSEIVAHDTVVGNQLLEPELNSELESKVKADKQLSQPEVSEVHAMKVKNEIDYYLWILIPALLFYSFILVKVVTLKFKKDIKVLEDELLKTKK